MVDERVHPTAVCPVSFFTVSALVVSSWSEPTPQENWHRESKKLVFGVSEQVNECGNQCINLQKRLLAPKFFAMGFLQSRGPTGNGQFLGLLRMQSENLTGKVRLFFRKGFPGQQTTRGRRGSIRNLSEPFEL